MIHFNFLFDGVKAIKFIFLLIVVALISFTVLPFKTGGHGYGTYRSHSAQGQ